MADTGPFVLRYRSDGFYEKLYGWPVELKSATLFETREAAEKRALELTESTDVIEVSKAKQPTQYVHVLTVDTDSGDHYGPFVFQTRPTKGQVKAFCKKMFPQEFQDGPGPGRWGSYLFTKLFRREVRNLSLPTPSEKKSTKKEENEKGTVGWLIEQLQQFDPTMEVLHGDHDNWFYDPSFVSVIKIKGGRRDPAGEKCLCIMPG